MNQYRWLWGARYWGRKKLSLSISPSLFLSDPIHKKIRRIGKPEGFSRLIAGHHHLHNARRHTHKKPCSHDTIHFLKKNKTFPLLLHFIFHVLPSRLSQSEDMEETLLHPIPILSSFAHLPTEEARRGVFIFIVMIVSYWKLFLSHM
jgi:hypothetical protein